MACDYLAATCVEWENREKLHCTNLFSQRNASARTLCPNKVAQCTSTQVGDLCFQA